jgi:hypothetical protein
VKAIGHHIYNYLHLRDVDHGLLGAAVSTEMKGSAHGYFISVTSNGRVTHFSYGPLDSDACSLCEVRKSPYILFLVS